MINTDYAAGDKVPGISAQCYAVIDGTNYPWVRGKDGTVLIPNPMTGRFERLRSEPREDDDTEPVFPSGD